MPRMIREGFLDSERVNSLDPLAERFFFRLLLVVDDEGAIEARPELLKARCFPVRHDVRLTDISRWIAECAKAGMIAEYTKFSRRYMLVLNFGQRLKHKRPSNCPSRDAPEPDGFLPGLTPEPLKAAAPPEVKRSEEKRIPPPAEKSSSSNVFRPGPRAFSKLPKLIGSKYR